MGNNDKVGLKVTKREATGKKVKALADESIVPGVVYGKDFTPVNVQADYNTLVKVVRTAGSHTPVELDIDGKVQTVIIKAWTMDYAKNRLNHVDFQAVSKDQIVTTFIPVAIVDEESSEAQKAGLMIMQTIEELEVKAKPADLPDKLEISARTLVAHGDKLTVADVTLPRGVELVDDDENLTLAVVEDPAVLAAANEAADKAADEAQAQAQAQTEEVAEGETPAEGETTDSTEETEEKGE